MKIGFIGAGVVAKTISKHVLAAGHRVLLSNTRGPESLAPLVKELSIYGDMIPITWEFWDRGVSGQAATPPSPI